MGFVDDQEDEQSDMEYSSDDEESGSESDIEDSNDAKV